MHLISKFSTPDEAEKGVSENFLLAFFCCFSLCVPPSLCVYVVIPLSNPAHLFLPTSLSLFLFLSFSTCSPRRN